MKQYWRVSTIRAFLGILLGMLVLGRYYYVYVPPLVDLGFIGAIILGTIFLVTFIYFGFLYDAKAKMWNEQNIVTFERNPYQYTPAPRFMMAEYPTLFAVTSTMRKLLVKLQIDTEPLDEFTEYLDKHFGYSPTSRSILDESANLGEQFMKDHPFVTGPASEPSRTSIRSRMKKGFLTEVWRMTQIQSVTGLVQDVFVFAAFYSLLLFPAVVVEGVLPVDYLLLGILLIAFPLLIVLVAIGWVYDKRLRLWSPTQIVLWERIPYSYVPEPRFFIFLFPIFYSLLKTYYDMFVKLNIDTTFLTRIIIYLDKHWQLTVKKESDMALSRKNRSDLGPLFKSKRLGGT